MNMHEIIKSEEMAWGGIISVSNRRSVQALVMSEIEKEYGTSSYYNHQFDSLNDGEVREYYARAIGRLNGLHGHALGLFINLRKSKCWDQVRSIPELQMWYDDYLKDFSWDSCGSWGINGGLIAMLFRKEFSKSAIVRLLTMCETVNTRIKTDGGDTQSTYNHHSGSGFHYGQWCWYTLCKLNAGHAKRLETFLRVFKTSRWISMSPVPSRYLKTLEHLSDEVLYWTISDERNWNGYRGDAAGERDFIFSSRELPSGCNKFRLNVIPKSIEEWNPVASGQELNRQWMLRVGRVPKAEHVRKLPIELVKVLTPKLFGKFLKNYKDIIDSNNNHLTIAAIKLFLNFGSVDVVKKIYSNSCFVSDVHDAGINLPDNKLTPEQIKFARRHMSEEKWSNVCRILSSWDAIIGMDCNPLGKDGYNQAMTISRSLVYDNVKDIDFAQEAAKWSLSQKKFEIHYERWSKGLDNLTSCSIPKIDVIDGDYRAYVLAKNDPRGIFLGHHTNCCQHPDSAGSECTWHGHENGKGGFFVIEKHGKILAQSWIWVNEDHHGDNCLVFDNVEGGYGDKDILRDLYIKAMKEFESSWANIKKFYIGLGGSDVSFGVVGSAITRPVDNAGYFGYSDSDRVWEFKVWETEICLKRRC